MTLTDLLNGFLISLLVFDLTVHWLAERHLREDLKKMREKIIMSGACVITIECDNSRAMAKIAEVTAAAHVAADALGRLH